MGKTKKPATLTDCLRAYERARDALYARHQALVDALKPAHEYEPGEYVDVGTMTGFADGTFISVNMSECDSWEGARGKVSLECVPEGAVDA